MEGTMIGTLIIDKLEERLAALELKLAQKPA
jgi:hypothetical protein